MENFFLLDKGKKGGAGTSGICSTSRKFSSTAKNDDVHVNETEGGMLLVKELNQMSLEDRNRALEDVHGVKDPVEETLEFVDVSLKRLEEEVNKIKARAAYERALFMSPSYVKDADFRIMFLRADFFDPKKAAMRMVNYFHHKLRLFGMDRLVRAITLDDLNEDDLSDMLAGSLQVLPQTDRSGRTVVVSFYEKHGYKSYENHHRMAWYTVMSLLEDPDAQRLGIAVVLYNVDYNSLQKHNLHFLMNSKFMSESLPMRYASCHFCYNDLRLLPLMSTFQLTITTEARVRFRAHFGSHMEVMYSLTSFGISRQQMPLDETCSITNDKVLEFIRKRREIEEEQKLAKERQSGATNLVESPRQIDVLLGRGRPYQQYPGNIQLAAFIDHLRAQYKTLDRLNKTSLTHGIVHMIKDSGGRFLKRADDGSGRWVEVSNDVAREKVSHGFRTKTRRRSSTEENDLRKRLKVEER